MTDIQVQYALEAAAMGMRIVPQSTNRKDNVPWRDVATTDPEQIQAWSDSERWGFGNFAFIAGEGSVWLIDVDHGHPAPAVDGLPNWEAICAGREIRTRLVRSPRGGLHYYFLWDDRLAAITLDIAESVEAMCGAHLVVLEGGFGMNGKEYEVIDDSPIAAAPDWLIEYVLEKQAEKRSRKKPRQSPDNVQTKSGGNGTGNRNVTLTSQLGSLRRNGAGYGTLLEKGLELNEAFNPPMDESEVEKIAESISKYPSGYIEADRGNADRLVDLYGDVLRYDHANKSWCWWDEVIWRTDANSVVERLVRGVAKEAYLDMCARVLTDPSISKEAMQFAKRSNDLRRIKAAMGVAAFLPGVPVDPDTFDTDLGLIGAGNGYIDLESGELLEADRELMVSKRVSVEYDPHAQCPRWERFILEIFKGDEELAAFIQRALGYSLTGEIREQCLFILYGIGRNGKSTLVEMVGNALGPYARLVQPETFLELHRRGGAASPDIASLPGIRFARTIETEKGRKLNVSLVKQVTGSDMVSARALFRDPFEFMPQFKLWMATNHLPKIDDSGEAMWRRMRCVPFRARFVGKDDDKNLKSTLMSELPGILSWIVSGARMWYADGLGTCAAVEKATAEYQAGEDIVGRFFDECLQEREGAEIEKKKLYEIYLQWCDQNGEVSMRKNDLGHELFRLGFRERRTEKTRFWLNIETNGEVDAANRERWGYNPDR